MLDAFIRGLTILARRPHSDESQRFSQRLAIFESLSPADRDYLERGELPPAHRLELIARDNDCSTQACYVCLQEFLDWMEANLDAKQRFEAVIPCANADAMQMLADIQRAAMDKSQIHEFDLRVFDVETRRRILDHVVQDLSVDERHGIQFII